MFLKYECPDCKWQSEPTSIPPFNCVNCGHTNIRPVAESKQPLDHPGNEGADKAEVKDAVASVAAHLEASQPAQTETAAHPGRTTTKAAASARAGNKD